MEHTEAVRLQAAEKYLLGELSSGQREEYEDHYFDCSACAEELKTTVAFMESAKQVAQERVPARAVKEVPVPARGGFFAWLRPAFAIPSFAALLLLVFTGYQTLVTVPNLKQAVAQSASAKIVNHFPLMAVGARGDNQLDVTVRPGEEFELDVDFPVLPSATAYAGQVQDAAGRIKFSLPVSLEQAKSTVYVKIPGGLLQAGKYSFVILAQGSDGGAPSLKEVKRLPFAVVIQQ